VCFVGDDEIEVGRREELLVLVIEEQGLDGGNNDLRTSPVVAVFLVNDRLKVGGQLKGQGLLGLVLQFQAVHEEEHAAGIAGTQEELDDGGCGQRLSGASGHLEEKSVLAVPD